jgi:hypothetical protein
MIGGLATRPKKSWAYSSFMLDALITAEIQALRLELCHFANRQSDPKVRSRCLTVVSMLGKAVERDDPNVREDLGNSVEQLAEAVHTTRLAIDPYNFLSLAPLTIADAKARFAYPIVLSFRS